MTTTLIPHVGDKLLSGADTYEVMVVRHLDHQTQVYAEDIHQRAHTVSRYYPDRF